MLEQGYALLEALDVKIVSAIKDKAKYKEIGRVGNRLNKDNAMKRVAELSTKIRGYKESYSRMQTILKG